MNRESALLGTKTFSIFSGKRPYLDEYLKEQGRMKFISTIEEIKAITPKKITDRKILLHSNDPQKEITDLLLDLGDKKGKVYESPIS